MGQSQAYKRRHPGGQGYISAQEYAGLTFRRIGIVRREEARQWGQAVGGKDSQGRPDPHSSQSRSKNIGPALQGRPGHTAQGEAGSREAQQARHTHHAQQAESRSAQGEQGSRGTRQARGQAAGSVGAEDHSLKHETR